MKSLLVFGLFAGGIYLYPEGKALSTIVYNYEYEDHIDTTLLFKQALIKHFGVGPNSSKTSRKSCNCDCDIKKETYLLPNTTSKLQVIDYCDSMEFEWTAENGNIDTLLIEMRQVFTELGFQSLNSEPVSKYKRKTYMIDIESDNNLTFLELREWEDGRIFMRLSIISQIGKDTKKR